MYTNRYMQINVYYIHAPDRRVPLADLLAGLNTAYNAGKFKRLGLSNFLASEVEEVLRIARENNFILPTVYQGNYNAVARHSEKALLPLLRANNISYYAYSPIAGGFLTKDVDLLTAGGEAGGRWDPKTVTGGLYTALYGKEGMLQGLRLWGNIAKEAGIEKAELAYRWVAFHSALDGSKGDSLIFGARNGGQIRGALAGVSKGPLPQGVVDEIERVWKVVEVDAPVDNFNGSGSK
jgi:aryl-alcohol dehydrogenase-like predicted oxidoreductase